MGRKKQAANADDGLTSLQRVILKSASPEIRERLCESFRTLLTRQGMLDELLQMNLEAEERQQSMLHEGYVDGRDRALIEENLAGTRHEVQELLRLGAGSRILEDPSAPN